MESTSPGLLKNGKMNVCTSTGSRENKQNKVRTQLWDTLYKAEKSPALSSSRVAVCKILFDVEFFMRIMEDRSALVYIPTGSPCSLFRGTNWKLGLISFHVVQCVQGGSKTIFLFICQQGSPFFWTPKNVANRR